MLLGLYFAQPDVRPVTGRRADNGCRDRQPVCGPVGPAAPCGRERHQLSDAAERILTGRELNRAVLARQLLLERSSGGCHVPSSGSPGCSRNTRAPRPAAGAPAPVRFLPTWDATLLVHARRTGFLPEPYRPLIFHSKIPQSVPTFLVDGAVAGTWKYDQG